MPCFFIFKLDDNIRVIQSDKLKYLRERRDSDKAAKCLAEITTAAVTGANLMPLVIDAVENYCTLGEISDTLRNVFGEYKQ